MEEPLTELRADWAPTPQQNAALELMVAFLKLLEVWQLTTERTPWTLSLNFHGGARRLDIATLTEDGQHLASYVMGIHMNILDLETFGTPAMLPSAGPVQ
jgi:hypothetical protein